MIYKPSGAPEGLTTEELRVWLNQRRNRQLKDEDQRHQDRVNDIWNEFRTELDKLNSGDEIPF